MPYARLSFLSSAWIFYSRQTTIFGLREKREAVEAEGVFIGGWSIKKAVAPQRIGGKIGEYLSPSFDSHASLTKYEQKAVRTAPSMSAPSKTWTRQRNDVSSKRSIFECCCHAASSTSLRTWIERTWVLQPSCRLKRDNIEETLHLHGINFNWVTMNRPPWLCTQAY